MSKINIPKIPASTLQNTALSETIPSLDPSTSTSTTGTIDSTINSAISQSSETLSSINIIKDELCKLPLDPCEREFIANNITPLLSVLTQLAAVSVSLATSTYYLTLSPIAHSKHSDIKDTIHLVYNINDQCTDVYHVVKERINTVLKKKC
jgi:hypothetical protein